MCKLDLIHYKKGQVWLMRGEQWTTEQRDMGITVGDRPVIIMNAANNAGNYVTVIPCSSKSTHKNGVFINLEPDTLSIALVQEIRPVSTELLSVFLGSMSDRIMEEIDTAIKLYFGLEQNAELMGKYFKYNKNKRGTIRDIGYDTNVTNFAASNTDNNELDGNNYDDGDNSPNQINTESKAVNRKQRSVITLDKMSDSDKEFIIKSTASEINKKFDVCLSTAYKWKRNLQLAKSDATENSSEQKGNNKPRIISTTRFNNKTYKKFASKN